MIYVVLGMHKSGTTLVSEILHNSGVNMVEDTRSNRSYDQGNFYERTPANYINKQIIGHNSSSIFDTKPPRSNSLTESQSQQISELVKACNEKYENWGFKDPRTCLSYNLWASELPEHKIIAIYRSPSETWQRYGRRSDFPPYLAWRYIVKWSEYNLGVLNAIKKGNKDFILLNYQDFVTQQSELEKLEKFVGIPLKDCRKMSLYRHKPKQSISLNIGQWLASKQLGFYPDHLLEEFETLRGCA